MEKTVRWYLENRGWCEAADRAATWASGSGWAAAEESRERNRSRRRLGDATISADEGGEQAALPRLRQADDLLSGDHVDARGHQGDTRDLDARGPLPLRGSARRRFAEGRRFQLRRAARTEGLAQAFVIGREFVGPRASPSSSGTRSSWGMGSPSSWSVRRAGRKGPPPSDITSGTLGVTASWSSTATGRCSDRGEAGEPDRTTP